MSKILAGSKYEHVFTLRDSSGAAVLGQNVEVVVIKDGVDSTLTTLLIAREDDSYVASFDVPENWGAGDEVALKIEANIQGAQVAATKNIGSVTEPVQGVDTATLASEIAEQITDSITSDVVSSLSQSGLINSDKQLNKNGVTAGCDKLLKHLAKRIMIRIGAIDPNENPTHHEIQDVVSTTISWHEMYFNEGTICWDICSMPKAAEMPFIDVMAYQVADDFGRQLTNSMVMKYEDGLRKLRALCVIDDDPYDACGCVDDYGYGGCNGSEANTLTADFTYTVVV